MWGWVSVYQKVSQILLVHDKKVQTHMFTHKCLHTPISELKLELGCVCVLTCSFTSESSRQVESQMFPWEHISYF